MRTRPASHERGRRVFAESNSERWAGMEDSDPTPSLSLNRQVAPQPVQQPCPASSPPSSRSEEHTTELQSRQYLHSSPTRRSSDLAGMEDSDPTPSLSLNRQVAPQPVQQPCPASSPPSS